MDDNNAEKVAFIQVPISDDDEASCSGSQEDFSRRHRSIRKIALLFIVSTVIISIGAAFLGFVTGKAWDSNPAAIAQKITQFSPVLDDIPLTYTLTQFNGSFLHETIFRKDASPEVDAAWANLGVNYRALAVPSDLAQRSGLAPDQVKINQKYGGGYPANVEGLHHLHCLNLLRQGLWYNYEYYHDLGQGAFKNEEFIVKYHVSHCLDILRQQLMCAVDVGMLGQVWVHPEAPEAFVDFNTRHKCRNFEAIRSWAEERQMPESVPQDWLEPPEWRDKAYEEIP